MGNDISQRWGIFNVIVQLHHNHITESVEHNYHKHAYTQNSMVSWG